MQITPPLDLVIVFPIHLIFALACLDSTTLGSRVNKWLGGKHTTESLSLSFLFIASPQQGDLKLSGPPSGHGAGSGARTRDRRVPADLRANSQATVLPTPHTTEKYYNSLLNAHCRTTKIRM
ncbi:hypothetical protein PoB_006699100 [Plakobranchus ocellatus]|uniref:Secreted protein n=1 Tax=Plakobranchus ocellatus TaxID=259542 RepID=A0AAV4D980_9GAST|nr:hypothetical protein PoB_006699100 [Plakobranchus ocellatus]